MTFSINGHIQTLQDTQGEGARERGLAAARTQQRVATTDRATDNFDPAFEVKIGELECVYVNQKKSDIKYVTISQGEIYCTVHLSNKKGEHVVVLLSDFFDWNWTPLISHFEDQTHIDAMFVGPYNRGPNLLPTTQQEQRNARLASEVEATLRAHFIRDANRHLNYTTTRQFTENRCTPAELREMMANHLYAKLNRNSLFHFGRPLKYAFAYDQPARDFKTNKPNLSATWLDVVIDFIQVPVMKSHEKLFDSFPVSRENLFEWMADLLFSKQGFEKLQPTFANRPFLSEFSINLATHRCMLRYPDTLQTPAEVARTAFNILSQPNNRTPLVVYTSKQPSKLPFIWFKPAIREACDKFKTRIEEFQKVDQVGMISTTKLMLDAVAKDVATSSASTHAAVNLTQLYGTLATGTVQAIKLLRELILEFKDVIPSNLQFADLYLERGYLFMRLVEMVARDPKCLPSNYSVADELERIFPTAQGGALVYTSKGTIELAVKTQDQAILFREYLQSHDLHVAIGKNAVTETHIIRISNPEGAWEKLQAVPTYGTPSVHQVVATNSNS